MSGTHMNNEQEHRSPRESGEDSEDESEILEESPCGRWLKRREEVEQRDVPGIDCAFLAMDMEEGVEVVWNEVQFSERKNFKNQEEKIQMVFENLTQLDHPNIVKFHRYWTDTHNDKPRVIFITEYMSSGSLKQFLKRTKRNVRRLPLQAWRRWCTQILSALSYLHSCSPPIIHGNLTCDTIFIQHNGLVKIGSVAPDSINHHVKTCQDDFKNMHFIAPEHPAISPALDIYAFGMCALEMAALEIIGNGESGKKVTEENVKQTIDLLEDDSQKDFIEKCLRKNPTERWSAKELLFHPLLFEVHSLKLLAAHVLVRNSGKLSNISETITDELMQRWYGPEVIVAEIRRGSSEHIQMKMADVPVNEKLEKFAEDVKNGIYPLTAFGAKQPPLARSRAISPEMAESVKSVTPEPTDVETRKIINMMCEVKSKEESCDLLLTIVLRMDDKMNRQLTSCISPSDNPKELAQELVHYGFINEVDIEKISALIEETLQNSSGHSSPVHKHNYNSSLPDSLPSIPPTDSSMTPEAWVSVHNLQSQGGGILDPDDRLSDVADDREQILASFEDGEGSHIHHGGGDGASGSSVGTGSPDIFHDGEHKYGPVYARTDIEVTGEQIASGVPSLQVRRGSEPTLNQLPAGPPAPAEHTKRWSAAPLILEPPTSGYGSPDWLDESKEEDGSGFKRIARDGSNRLSMQFLGDGPGYRWAEAAERLATSNSHTSKSLPREARRKEPLGQANSSPPPWPTDKTDFIVIRNQPGPLGIHVVPDYDGSGKDRGLLVQGIEPGGRIDRDGRLAIYDRIVEINGQNLINIPFQRVQEIFKLSLISPELRLKVVKASGLESLRKPPTPIYPSFRGDKENNESTNTKIATVSPTKKVPAISKNLKGLLTANTRKIGRKIEIELVKGPRGLGFSITTRDNPAGGNCPIYIKNIIPEGAAVEDGRLKIGDRLLQVNDEEMTGKSQSEAVAILRKVPAGSKVKIVVSRQEDVPVTGTTTNGLPRVIGIEETDEREDSITADLFNNDSKRDIPPNIPPLPQSHLLHSRSPIGSVAKIVSQFQEAANLSNPLEKSDSAMVFPWKHREILTLNIPVHDSEKAGLGISVKGKTSESGDLGIFIKSVINGGAASRDKRLRTNDQLLNVNGKSLLQQSNSDAMETLRKAMLHTEGPVPGNITLTIARRASSPGSSRNRSNESLLNVSQTSQDFYNSQDASSDPSGENSNSNASNGSTNTVIYNPHQNGMVPSQLSPMHTWNPVLERLTGKQQLRNESYYKATHDTWSNSMLANSSALESLGGTTVVNLSPAEPILIEDEYGSRVVPFQNHQQQINVHMTNKPSHINHSREDHEPDGKPGDKSAESASQTTIQGTDATYSSQLSLENPQGFSRDAFGRQSMSEKRHATLDAKSTDTYQRTKKMREERIKKESNIVRVGSVESVISVNRSSEHPEYADKLTELGPSLGMKKSSSLESLQTMVQEIQMQEEGDPAYSYRGTSGALKVIRGRGSEETFRAAVVDPNHRNEMGAKKHWLLDGPVEEREIDGFTNVRGGPRQSSLNAALDTKNKQCKKKPGIFKGIGSMFRFGKHRKVDLVEPVQQYHQKTNEFDNNANVSQYSQQSQNSENQQQSEDNQSHHSHSSHNTDCSQHKQHGPGSSIPNVDRPQEQNQGSAGNPHLTSSTQRDQQIQREPIYQRHGFVHRHAEQVQVIPENAVAPPVKYRQNVNQNRDMARQRLAHRHTYYQSDERENIYDRQPQHQSREPQYGEFGRPGSRSGITEAPPVPFTHYVNYNELQTHISRKESLSDSQIVQMRLQVQQQRLKVEEESRKQHQYHSQRQPRPESQLRPMSNYYEYESVQSVLNNRQGRPPNPHYPPPDINANPLQSRQNLAVHSRPGQPRGNAMPRQSGQPHRGPFVTQVTIGEHQKNGTKV